MKILSEERELIHLLLLLWLVYQYLTCGHDVCSDGTINPKVHTSIAKKKTHTIEICHVSFAGMVSGKALN